MLFSSLRAATCLRGLEGGKRKGKEQGCDSGPAMSQREVAELIVLMNSSANTGIKAKENSNAGRNTAEYCSTSISRLRGFVEWVATRD